MHSFLSLLLFHSDEVDDLSSNVVEEIRYLRAKVEEARRDKAVAR